jgi:hypothetical protein
MPRGLARIAPFLTAVLAAGCFDFDATTAGGVLTDAGVTGDATLPVDASVDGGALDGGAPEAGGSFCANAPRADGGLFFCDDFDEAPLPGSWQTWAQTAGTLVDTDAGAVSPPTAVDESIGALGPGQAVNVALRTPIAVPAAPATLSFGFSVEPIQIDTAASAAIVLGAIDFLDGQGNRYSVGLAINVASGLPALALGEQTGVVSGGNLPDGAAPTFVNHPLSQTSPLAMGSWSQVTIEIDWTPGGLEGRVAVNGAAELDTPLTMAIVPTSLQIGVGTTYVTEYEAGLSPPWELRYDNVVFTTR